MRKTSILILITLMILALCACGTSTETAESMTEAESAASVTEPAMKMIGEETDTATAVMMEVANATGKDITAWAMKMTGETEFSDNMLEDGDPFLREETRILSVDPENDNENRLCEVQVTIDGKDYTIHNVPLDDAEAVEICMEEEIVYLKYQSLTSKQEVNTLADEQAVIEAEKKAEAAPAAATPVSGGSAAGSSYSGGSSSSGSSSGSSYSSGENSSSDYSEPVSGGDTGSSGGSSDDGCIGDDGLMY